MHTVQFNWSNTSWHEETGETESNGQHTLTAASGSGLHQRGITNTLTGPAGGYYEVVNVRRPRTMSLSDGHVSDTGHTQTVIDRTGTDPLTGYNVDWHWDSDDPSTWTNEGDWFKQVSDFGAGMADTLTAGLTEKIRQGAGYDDVVNKNSTAYKVGVVPDVLDVALTPVNPCGKLKWLKYASRIVFSSASTYTAGGQAFRWGQHDVALIASVWRPSDQSASPHSTRRSSSQAVRRGDSPWSRVPYATAFADPVFRARFRDSVEADIGPS